MDEEKIISKEMVLTLFLIFSIFGVIYLYCAGGDSWEGICRSYKDEKAVKYHFKRFINTNGCEENFILKYEVSRAFLLSSEICSLRKEKLFPLEKKMGDHYLFWDQDMTRSAAHYRRALGFHYDSTFYNAYQSTVKIFLAYALLKKGKVGKCRFFLDSFSADLKKYKKFLLTRNQFTYYKTLLDFYTVSAYYCIEKSQYQRALHFIEKGGKVASELPGTAGVRFAKVMLYKKMKNFPLLQKELEKLDMTFQGEFVLYIYRELLTLYEKKNEYKKCVRFIRKKLEFFKKDPVFGLSVVGPDLVRIYEKMGEKENVSSLKKRIIPLTPKEKSYIEKTGRAWF